MKTLGNYSVGFQDLKTRLGNLIALGNLHSENAECDRNSEAQRRCLFEWWAGVDEISLPEIRIPESS